jgi:ABC-type phosphate transport system substrate-binding protein
MIRLTKGRAGSARRRSAYVACAALLVVAFGASSATSASALGEQCSGTKATGLGAFLQTRAQTVWDSDGKVGFNSSTDPLACSGSQGSGGIPGVSYVPVSSSAALRTWGAEDGVLHEKEFGFPVRFLATDIAPSGPVSEAGTMLAKMKAALASDVAVIPVTQTAIAIAAHPPALPAHAPCTVPRITANQLQRVFSGEIANWRQIATASDPSPGGDCDQAITRIVRDESAGTTYQFKHFLNQINPSPLSCSGKGKRTWSQLQAPFGGETAPNIEWPSNPQCLAGEGHVTTVSGPGSEGEFGPLHYVAEAAGTITYGSLPEAQLWAPKQIINVNNGVKYTSPETSEGGANCGAAKYTRPTGWESGVDVDWSQVYGSDPLIGEVAKNAYPICTLTWDVAATNRFSEAAATTVHDYLAFAIGEGGQAAVRHIGYRDLPAPVAKAAAAAIAHINGSEEGEEEEKEGEEEGGGTGTVLCTEAPEPNKKGVLRCPPGAHYTGSKVIGKMLPKTVATFASVAGPERAIECPEGRFSGLFNEDGSSEGSGLSELQFFGCSTNPPEEGPITVGFENPPFDASAFEYQRAEVPQGSFLLAKSEGVPLLRIDMGSESGTVCVFAPGFIENSVFNGTPTAIATKSEWKLVEGSPEGVCPTQLVGAYQMTIGARGGEEPLYIAGE